MAWYARVVDGIVVEPAVNLPGTDLPSKYFPASLPGTWEACANGDPQSGWTFTAPSTFTAPTVAIPAELVSQAAYQAFIGGGLTVTSTGTSALNGVYAIDPASQANIATEAQFISTFAEFTNGETTNLSYPLMNGTLVAFPTTTEFMAFAKMVAQTVASAKLAMAQNAAMPSANVTIP